MQINSKLGGAPWAVSECPLSNKPTMVMGINVWKKNYKAKHSIISLTASVNIRYNKYITICDEIGPNEDLGSKMKILVEKAIESFLKINKTEIARLIIYRDGVSESQQTQVLIYEVEPIKSALKEKNISFAFIIVNKRTQTRYYVQEGRLKGPTPGMLVDEGIVSQKNGPSKDFYLVSQIAKQGAASPTHYHILHIDEGLHKSDLMLLTYKLCFLYFHINSGIKVPAPIQYSERLGALLGDSVNAKANEKRPDENGKIYTLPGKRFLNKPGLFFI